jgi:iron complex transport system substrate-binding protein
MFRPLRLLTLLAGALLALGACASAPAAQPPTPAPAAAVAAPTTAAPAAPAALTITDALGRQVTLDGAPARIVSLAPSITEILFAVGAGPQVVGVTQFCNYPPEADALPEVGGFTAKTISVEAIVDLTPDLVLAGSAAQQPVVEALEQLGIPALVFDPTSFEEVYANIQQVGYATGHVAEADELVASMRGRVKAVADVVAAIPAEERPSVFWEVFDEPLMTAGPNTFIGQMIDLAGAKNIFADATEDYPQISAETILERDPAIILGPSSHGDKLTPELVAARPGWGELSAVKAGRVHLLDGDTTSRPGPRLADALEELAKTLYPERFQ